ncbi:MAG: CHAD domain-containing protein [Sneathiella sp.]|nr:CHAD domain-containing protein [Sneathiella sp.]
MVGKKPVDSGAENRANKIKLRDLNLANDFNVEAAAKLIFRECVHHLRLNLARYCDHRDDIALVQIRIGLRRTRVALKIFKTIIYPETYKKLKKEFRYFGRLLGDASDLDVFLKGMLNKTCPLNGLEATYEELRSCIRLMRDQEQDQIHEAFTGERFQGLLQIFDDWIERDRSLNLGWADTDLSRRAIGPFAVGVISKGRKDLLARGSSIEALSIDDLHNVRKYVKRSRYHLRFFSSLFDQKTLSEGYHLLVQMQDCLGYVNDVREGLKLISVLGGEVRADHISNTLRLMAVIVAKASEDVENHLETFAGLWRQYESYELTEANLL